MTNRPEQVESDEIEHLIAALRADLAGGAGRYLLGITGPPGAGKSTLAVRIADAIGDTARVAPMDGFHRSNDDLAASGLLPLKGVPESFDGARFVRSVARLRTTGPVPWPTYDRSRQEVVPAGIIIDGTCRLVIVEGNYLLLTTSPWDRLRDLLDTIWYLDVPHDVLIPRLRARHERDRNPADAWAKVRSTDLPNAATVEATRNRADVVIR